MDAEMINSEIPLLAHWPHTITGVAWRAAHISAMIFFCCLFHLWLPQFAQTTKETRREKLLAVKLLNVLEFFAAKSEFWSLEGNREDRRKKGARCPVQGARVGRGQKPWSLQVKLKSVTDCLSTMDPTDWSLHPPSVQWNRCNRNGWTEFSQREFKKGRPCGGLPSKPSCVKVHRMTHPFSSYYKP